jgi:periplasmic mercuric ion binding protein
MRTMLMCITFGLTLLAASAALAGERTITLAVQNMYCADCPFVVKKKPGSSAGRRSRRGLLQG